MKAPGSRLLSAICLFLANAVCGQAPVNDNCESADEIVITNRGFDFGTFVSRKFDVEKATRQRGEKCAPELETYGNCDKTVWFKFYIPTTRNISVKLTQQDSAIPQIFAGFNLYKVKDCNYSTGDLALNLAPLTKFGQSGNTCLIAGWYYIQVGCKQKAKGQLWIELNSQAQTAQAYDDYTSPLDMGLVKDKNVSAYLMTACASVEEAESKAINDSSMGKSVFCTFTLPPNSIYDQLTIYSSHKVKYRIFRDNINADSIKGNKPFMVHDGGSWEVMLDFCGRMVNKNQKYYIQFVAPSEGDAWYYIYIMNTTYSIDKWNTPATNDIIYTNNSFSRTIQHRYNCEGLMKKHGCKPTIPDCYSRLFVNFNGDTTYDSFDMAGYTVIHASEDGTLNVISRNDQGYSLYHYYTIYQGDITKGCNIKPLHSDYTNSFDYCISPGTYTLVTACHRQEFMGMNTHTIQQKPTVLNTVHYYPKDPEDLDTFSPAAKVEKYSTSINFNQSRDTTLTVDTFSIHGYFIFREFYLNEPSSLSFYESDYAKARYYIFEGRLSKGKVSLLKNYTYNPWSNSSPIDNCVILDSGFYTIVSRLDTIDKTLPCVAPYSAITISPPFKCSKDTFLSPLNAYKINNNNDVLLAGGNKKNLDYVFPLPYCTDCAEQKLVPSLLQFKKRFASPSSRYSYYTFYISQNLEFRINLDYSEFELYKGNAITNPSLIKDTNNIVSACNWGNVYCNLEGGKYYTLVTFNISSIAVKAYFTPHRISPNDFASHAYDLGHFNTNSSKSSAPMPITCHTNASANDPCFYENGVRRCLWNGPLPYIPYKDTLNIKHSYIQKNIWYTFTVDNPSHVLVKLKGNTPLARVRQMSVYRYRGPYQQNASLALASLDSTEKSMNWLGTNQRIYTTLETRADSVAFDNIGCGLNRYFVLLEDDYFQQDPAHYEYIVTVKYTAKNLPNAGDYCNDPAAISFNSLGTLQVSANNACHTYGGSPYEDDSLNGVKSSWYKIKVNNITKCDLKLKNLSGNGLLYFNVYGGSCGGLTKIAHLADLYSYFTLSCMGSGEYYIQAVCDEKTNSVVTFEVSLLKPENPNCKAYDFRNPLAQFHTIGGCNNDTIRFENLSTSGSDITYSWYINGKIFSSLKAPMLLLGNPLIKPSNTIKLLVHNKSENTYDSSSSIFVPDTTTYYFTIDGPDSIYCSDTALFKVNTNFPYKINYTWTDNYSGKAYYTNQYQITALYYERKIYVSGESDNCRFRDSTKVKLINIADNFRDTSVCSGGGSLTYYTKSYIRIFLDGKEVLDSFRITKPGKYRLYYLKAGCWQEEYLNVEIDTGKVVIREKDVVTVCNQAAVLSYKKNKLNNTQWSTGETSQDITVSNAGTYVLTGNINNCRSVEYTVSVVIQHQSLDFLRDTTVCKNDMVRFVNPVPSSTVISRVPNLDSMRITQPLQRKLAIKKDLCILRDSAMVNVVMLVNEHNVITYCDSGGKNSIMLDAGIADAYLWSRAAETSRNIQVTGYGKFFAIRMHKPSCYDSAYFMLYEDCPFNVYIPTAFTPNNNMLNEIFGPVITGAYDHYVMTIFNRWGEMLYITQDSKAWNGFYKDELVMNGVYAYMITVYDSQKRAYQFSGTFTLLY